MTKGDDTERKGVGNLLRARLRLAEAAYKGPVSSDDVLRLTLDELEARTGSKIGFYHFLEEDQETLSLRNWSTNTVANMCSIEGAGSHYNISRAGVWVDCVRERKPVIHNDYASLPHRKGMPPGHAPVVREMVVPIMRGERIVAIIGVGNKETDYTDADIGIAKLLGDFSWEIVERKRAEEALRASEERLRYYLENSPLAVVEWDADFVVTRWAGEAEKIFGWSAAETIGKPIMDLHMIYDEDIPVVQKTMEKLTDGISRHVVSSNRNYTKDGRVIHCTWYNTVLLDVAGKMRSVMSQVLDITEHKRAEALTSRLAALVESADDAIISKDLNGIIQSWNIGAEKIYGYTAEEAMGRNIAFLEPPGQKDSTPEIIERLSKGEHINNFETVRMRKDGTIVPVSLTFSAIRDASGKVMGISKIAHDVTERKRAEDALKASERRYHSLFESMTEGFAFCKMLFDSNNRPADFIYLDVNSSFRKITGLENVVGRKVTEAIPGIKELHPELFDIYGRVALTGKPERFDIEFRPLGMWLSVSAYSIEIGYFVAVFDDITVRKKVEEALRETEEQFRTLANSIPNLAWWANGDGYLTWYNQRWYDYTGTTPEQMEGWGWQSVHDPEMLPKVLERWKTSLATGEPFDMEFPLRGADGVFRSFLTRVMPLKDAAGKVLRWFGTNTDVSERKKAEAEIKQRVEELNAANEELLRFNRAAVDRELRMIELKKELNELHMRAGQEPPYPLDFEKEEA